MDELEASLTVARDQDGTLFDPSNGFGDVNLTVKDFLPSLDAWRESFFPEEFPNVCNREFVHPDLFGGFGD